MRRVLIVALLGGLLGGAWWWTQEVGRDDTSRRGEQQSGSSEPLNPEPDGERRAEIEELTQTEGGSVTFPPGEEP